jgi:hypothetical protein
LGHAKSLSRSAAKKTEHTNRKIGIAAAIKAIILKSFLHCRFYWSEAVMALLLNPCIAPREPPLAELRAPEMSQIAELAGSNKRKSSRNYPGRRLNGAAFRGHRVGLPITRKLARMMGGDVYGDK